MKSLSVFFPAFNEAGNIADVVSKAVKFLKTKRFLWEIIIVDDGSTDNTFEIAKELAKKDYRIRVVTQPNSGYGIALRTGFRQSRYDWICYTDSDGQFDFSEIEKFLPQTETAEAIWGYRISRQDKFYRLLNAFGWRLSVSLVLGVNLKDPDCGFKMFKKSIIEKIQPLESTRGAMINAELAVKIKHAGGKIAQVGVTHYPRRKGQATGASLPVILNSYRELGRLGLKFPGPLDPWLVFFGLAFLATRLYNLLILPIFTDESIYLYWAKTIATTHSHWFISLTDGKPPILIWLVAIFLQIFPSGWYLLAGRLAVVLISLFGVVGTFFLAREMFSRRVAVITTFLYLLSPFYFFHDRMVLFDSPLSAMLVWSTYFAVRTAQLGKLWNAIFWGFFLGLAFLFKPTALFFVPITFLVALFLSKQKLSQTVPLAFVALVLSELLNNLQRISRVYYLMAAKNSQFQQPITDLLRNPLALFSGNFPTLIIWFKDYLTWPIFFAGILANIILIYKKTRVGLVLLALWLAPLIGFALVGREIFPRYILFTSVYFLLPVGYLVGEFGRRRGLAIIGLALLVVLLYLPIKFDYQLLTNPPAASFPDFDYHQYVSEHPSGYGLDEVLTYLNNQQRGKPIYIVTQGTFGLYPYAFNLYYWNNPNFQILPVWPLDRIDPGLKSLSHDYPGQVYFILKEHEEIPKNLGLQAVFKATKPGGRFPIYVAVLK